MAAEAITTPNIDGDMGKATYSGKALGISVLTAADGNNRKAIKSGEFTADVRLTATFKAEPKVEGTIDNFKGNAVGDDWEVKLTEAGLTNAKAVSSDLALTQVTGALDGRWHARAHSGTESKRPLGISGAFRSFFPNGRAVGGYATIKDD